MNSKLTKTERIAQKVAEGMTNIEAEIAVTDEIHAEKKEQLLKQLEREETVIAEMAVDVVRKAYPDVYAQALAEARELREKQKAERNARVRAKRRANGEDITDDEDDAY